MVTSFPVFSILFGMF